jgi:opacity protein-like surface antigen
MLKNLMKIGSLAGVLSLTSIGGAQALPTATGHGGLQVGVGWSYVEPDYGQKAIQGVTAFGDFDFLPHIGVEAEYHYIALITPTDLAENSYLIGPRYILPHGRFNLYAKAMFGIGDIVIQEQQDNPQGGAGNYFAYGLGGGVDYRVTRRIVARANFEYQHWGYQTGLTPAAITLGVAYKFR